jgi:hypothetical protein
MSIKILIENLKHIYSKYLADYGEAIGTVAKIFKEYLSPNQSSVFKLIVNGDFIALRITLHA